MHTLTPGANTNNNELGQELDATTDKLSQAAPIDDAEASLVLAKYNH